MNPFRTSLLSFLGGLSMYFGALVGLQVLENALHGAWLLPGSLLLFGGMLLTVDLRRELRTTTKRTKKSSDKASSSLPVAHDLSYALSLASRSSHLPRPR